MKTNTWLSDIIEKGLNKLEAEKKLPGYFDISAINSVPYIQYPGFSEHELKLLQDRAKEVMKISRNENHYNEVSITYKKNDLNKDHFIKVLGNCGNIFLDDDTMNLLNASDGQNELIAIMIHNHPNNSIFSVSDLLVFSEHPSIKLMEIINKKGEIAFLLRPKSTNLSNIVIRSISDHIPDIKTRIANYQQNNPDIEYTISEISNKSEREAIYNDSIEQIINRGIICSHYIDQNGANALSFTNNKNTTLRTTPPKYENTLETDIESNTYGYMENGEDGHDWFTKD